MKVNKKFYNTQECNIVLNSSLSGKVIEKVKADILVYNEEINSQTPNIELRLLNALYEQKFITFDEIKKLRRFNFDGKERECSIEDSIFQESFRAVVLEVPIQNLVKGDEKVIEFCVENLPLGNNNPHTIIRTTTEKETLVIVIGLERNYLESVDRMILPTHEDFYINTIENY